MNADSCAAVGKAFGVRVAECAGVSMRLRIAVICAVATMWAVPAWAAQLPISPAMVPATQRADAERLIIAALSEDPRTCTAAIDELEKLRTPLPVLRQLVRHILIRDQQTVLGARLPVDAAVVAGMEQRLAVHRREMRDLIARLEDPEAVKLAEAKYQVLMSAYGELCRVYHVRWQVLAAMRRRQPLLEIWRRTAEAGDRSFPAEAEQKLVAAAERIVGMPQSRWPALPLMSARVERDPSGLDGLGFYIVCREIEAWNCALEQVNSPQELINTMMVNAYREALGVLPCEMDAALVQAARRHSREMIELKYHGHTSPDPANRTVAQRIRNAGYAGAGWGENCGINFATGERVFWGWFRSAAHHRNMVGEHFHAIGVGRWDHAWTQNYGCGPRLMLMSAEQRARHAVAGPLLPPQPDEKAAPPARRRITTTEWRIYDPNNPGRSERIGERTVVDQP